VSKVNPAISILIMLFRLRPMRNTSCFVFRRIGRIYFGHGINVFANHKLYRFTSSKHVIKIFNLMEQLKHWRLFAIIKIILFYSNNIYLILLYTILLYVNKQIRMHLSVKNISTYSRTLINHLRSRASTDNRKER